MNTHQTTLIILPGWGGTKQSWQEFVDLVSADFQAVKVVELPGFGAEKAPGSVWGVSDYAAFAAEKIRATPGKKILLGHSFGGQVAVWMLAHKQVQVAGVILSGAAVVRPKRGLKRALLFPFVKLGRFFRHVPFASRICARLVGTDDYLRSGHMMKRVMKKVIRQDLQHLLPKISQRVAVFWGKHDRHTPVGHGRKILQQLPNAELSLFETSHGIHVHKKKELREALFHYVNAL